MPEKSEKSQKIFSQGLSFPRAHVIMVNMKKQMTILSAAALALALALAGGQLYGSAEADGARTELFLPGSYEQYLPLSAPADVAVSDEYIAVADGAYIYLYARGGEEGYKVYRHRPGASTPISVSKIQFAGDGKLYLADTAQEFFSLDPATLEVSDSLLSLSTFCIAGSDLYAVTVALSTGTTIYQLDMTRPLSIDEAEHSQELSRSPITPSMTYTEGTLVCAVTGTAYLYDGDTLAPKTTFLLDNDFTFRLETVSLCAEGGMYCYTDARGLSVTDAGGNSLLVYEGDDFGALTSCGDKLYCVKGATVRELTASDPPVYTGYEIAAASDSANRLSGAEDTVRARGLIVTADRGNGRVSVYDAEKENYYTIDCGDPLCVATDGEIIAVGVGSEVRAYKKGETDPYLTHSAENPVTGLACVYGSVYYITSHAFGKAEDGAREVTRADLSPAALTSDVFGDLYVADGQNRVTKYTEAEFLDAASEGAAASEGWSLPSGYRSLRADFMGNLYYLSGSRLYRNGAPLFTFNAADAVYYGVNGGPQDPVSFALGFEDNAVYVQYGNFMLRTEAVSFPTLSTIAADGFYADLFTTPGKDGLSFLDVRADATGILVDVDNLTEESECFPYVSYARTAEGGRGILLGEKDGFGLVALFEDHGYSVALYRPEDCTEVPVAWTDVSPALRYASNDVYFTYYPCLAPSLAISRLPRAAELTMLATVTVGTEDGSGYAYVRYGNLYGYLPLSYLSASAPVSPPADDYTIGYLKASAEGVVFHSQAGDEVVSGRTQVKIYELRTGLYRVTFERDGVEYTAQVTQSMLETGNPTVLRTSIIGILCVIAVGIILAYVLLVPRKKKR